MEGEGEPAAGQVGDGEGRQLITPSHPPTPTTTTTSTLLLFLFIAAPSLSLLSAKMIDEGVVDFVACTQIQKAPSNK